MVNVPHWDENELERLVRFRGQPVPNKTEPSSRGKSASRARHARRRSGARSFNGVHRRRNKRRGL